jgi:D-alanyl-D-alanine dipeptidase
MNESLRSKLQSVSKRPMAVLNAQAFDLGFIGLACTLSATVCATASDLPFRFVRLADIAPSIRQEIRYANSNNFTGRPVPGYAAPECWLRKEAALALAAVQTDALKQGLKLVVYDCYRPQRATNAFVKWANDDAADQIAKDRFFPGIEKRALFSQGYISRRSSHSTGLAVDIAIDGLDFGTPFDFFDPRSSTNSQLVTGAAAANRRTLEELMRHRGYSNYKREWWHFTYNGVHDPKAWDIELK